MGKLIRKYWWVIFLVPFLLVGGFAVWAAMPLEPMPEALAALQTDSLVQVDAGSWLIFRPAGESPTTGVILYPGGRVDYRAYAPFAREIAIQGYLVVIPRMPLNLAFFAASRAGDVMTAYPDVQRWAVGGHSLGGAMAARFAAVHWSARQADAGTEEPPPSAAGVDGLFLWAAFPAQSDDLSQYPLQTVVVYGLLDGLATPEEVQAAAPRLPPAAAWTAIAGGNHAQFGWYGAQPGDNPAQLTRQEQMDQTVQATLEMLERLK